jgi:hypothetical protein
MMFNNDARSVSSLWTAILFCGVVCVGEGVFFVVVSGTREIVVS